MNPNQYSNPYNPFGFVQSPVLGTANPFDNVGNTQYSQGSSQSQYNQGGTQYGQGSTQYGQGNYGQSANSFGQGSTQYAQTQYGQGIPSTQYVSSSNPFDMSGSSQYGNQSYSQGQQTSYGNYQQQSYQGYGNSSSQTQYSQGSPSTQYVSSSNPFDMSGTPQYGNQSYSQGNQQHQGQSGSSNQGGSYYDNFGNLIVGQNSSSQIYVPGQQGHVQVLSESVYASSQTQNESVSGNTYIQGSTYTAKTRTEYKYITTDSSSDDITTTIPQHVSSSVLPRRESNDSENLHIQRANTPTVQVRDTDRAFSTKNPFARSSINETTSPISVNDVFGLTEEVPNTEELKVSNAVSEPPKIPNRQSSNSPAPTRPKSEPPTVPSRPATNAPEIQSRQPQRSIMSEVQNRINSAYLKQISVITSESCIVLVHEDPGISNIVITRRDGHPGSFDEVSDISHIQGRTTKGYGVMGIITIAQESFLIFITEVDAIGSFQGKNCYQIKDTVFIPFDRRGEFRYGPHSNEKPPYNQVQKFINSGTFYFSYEYPLTLSLQKQSEYGERLFNKPMWKTADRSFFWNQHISKHFIKNRFHNWVLVVIRGYVHFTHDQFLPQSQIRGSLGLISRISCLKAGTRFNSRGINDDGHVANFVETEQILIAQMQSEAIFSFVQIRGSVPVFWEQNFSKGKHKVVISRSPEATTPASLKHFQFLRDEYEHVHVVNLLSQKGNKETDLSNSYKEQFMRYPECGEFDFSNFDFHEECGNKHFERVVRIFDSIDVPLRDNLNRYGYFSMIGGDVVTLQDGTFRTNCLDCLDRTNVVQGTIAKESLINQLVQLRILKDRTINDISSFGKKFKILWADNGDNISMAYAGTGAMKSSYTRTGKRSLAGMFDDGLKSVTRMYINNFKDDTTQESIDYFLGNIEETIELQDEDMWVKYQLKYRKPLFSTTENVNIFFGTWNCNTFAPEISDDLSPFISPNQGNDQSLSHDDIHLYIFGFQEIVELTGQAVVNATEKNMRAWEQVLLAKINRERSPNNQIVLARSEQLVGIAIVMFVRKDWAGSLRNVVFAKVKSGVKGLAGNKGAICARFDIKDSSVVCSVCHLAAGQSKTEQRIKDINDISAVKFKNPECPRMDDHDYIFWMGDFNFRVSLPRMETDNLIAQKQWDTLLEYDQFNMGQANRWYFSGYKESNITFPPTYKYDFGTDRYDTSEKMRVPSWCDRIIYKVNDGSAKNIMYGRGEMYQSDHRPVKGLFQIQVLDVDKKAQAKMEKSLYKITATLEESVIQNYHMPYGVDDAVAILNNSTEKEEEPLTVIILEYLDSYNALSNYFLTTKSNEERMKSCINLLVEVVRKMIQKLIIHEVNDFASTLEYFVDSLISESKKYVDGQRGESEYQSIYSIISTILQEISNFIQRQIE
eukprot:TRINITY_DN2092_c0_g2_i7.p1 TRINITY_DN2092_c0_g2~~TRINITY_DN2092_c0_g2_i7.p1  ORF type:complete len:1408 (+),score=290.74 TRINITY_DN2092_c0_g2_i7:24-4247(+)